MGDPPADKASVSPGTSWAGRILQGKCRAVGAVLKILTNLIDIIYFNATEPTNFSEALYQGPVLTSNIKVYFYFIYPQRNMRSLHSETKHLPDSVYF